MVSKSKVVRMEEDFAMRDAVISIDELTLRDALRLSAQALALKAEDVAGVDVSAKTMIILTVDGTLYRDGWVVAFHTNANGWRGAALVAYGCIEHNTDEGEGGYHFFIVDLDADIGDALLVAPRQETTKDRVADFGDNAWLYLT